MSSSTATAAPARLVLVARDIKLSHSVFALPFALLATFLAAHAMADGTSRFPQPGPLLLIVLCMVLARTTAMAFNRWADRGIDAANPRTAGRAVPSGAVSARYMLGVIVICAVGFVVTTTGFWLLDRNPWPLVLSPLVLAWLCAYSLTKRFTWLCHLFLGSALAISPIAAAIAIEPGYLVRPDVYFLAAMVLCWVAGFDIIYALQDVASDRRTGIHSMPANLGVESALWISRLLHAVCAGCLVALTVISTQLGTFFAAAVAVTVGLLILEHVLVFRDRENRIHAAFFSVNSVISLLLGAAGVADLVLG